jgi:uncharacterized protein (DUF983 family)
LKTTFRLYLPKKKPPPPEPVHSFDFIQGVPPRGALWRTLLARAARLHCPVCDGDGIFADYLTLRERCPGCQYRFEREEGYWLGAMTINYGVVGTLGVLLFALATTLWSWPALAQVAIWAVFATVGLIWFFPYSRLAWILFDFTFFSPPGERDFPPTT